MSETARFSVDFVEYWFSPQFQRLLFLIREKRFRCLSRSPALQSSDSFLGIALCRRDVYRWRPGNRCRFIRRLISVEGDASFSPPPADAEKVMDRTGSNGDRQMFLEEARDLSVGISFSPQHADHVSVRLQF